MDMKPITIAPQQVTPELLALFDISRPTMPRAFNVLEGVTRGEILVDDPSRPSWAAVREAMFGTLYLGGQVDSSLLTFLVEHFRQSGQVGIACWLDDPLNEMIPSDPDYGGRTLYFTKRLPVIDAPSIRLPPGYNLVSRDADHLSRSLDYEATLHSFGTEEDILRHTLGVLILDGDTLVCEAASGAPSQGLIEMGVKTAEEYRGRGFATVACIQLIEICEARGYNTWWDCAKQNTASVRLANKLGYQNQQEYRYVGWAKK
jgi:GNAT superfamily N-acetyltransferase